jgi:4-carboxymuconolactone decarboxylase
MSVIPKIDEPDSKELRELYERLSANPMGNLNIFRIMAYNPKLLRNWLRMATPLLTGGLSLEPRLREIAILRVAQNVRSDYEFGHHIPIARATGVTDEEMAALKDFAESGCFSDLERAVVLYTDAVSLLDAGAPDLARELRRWLSDRELLELSFCIGHWNMVARVLVPLEVEVDDSLEATLPEGWREWL